MAFDIDKEIDAALGNGSSPSAPATTKSNSTFDIDKEISSALSAVPSAAPVPNAEPPKPPESLAKSIGGGALAVANGATGGLLPQLTGFQAGAKNSVSNVIDDLLAGNYKDAILGRKDGINILRGGDGNVTKNPAYQEMRNNTANVLADVKTAHPITSEINNVGGTLLGPGAAATKATAELGRIAAPVVGNALVGGGTTAAQQNWDSPAQALGNTVTGAGIGGALGLIPGAIGATGDALKSGINKAVTAAQPASKVLDSPVAALGMKAADFLDKYKMLPNDLNKQVSTAKQLMDDPTSKLAEMTKNGISGLVRGKTNMAGAAIGIPPVVTDKLAKPLGNAVGAGTMKAGSFAADHASRSATYAPLSAWLSGTATKGMNDAEKRKTAMENQVVKKEDQ